MAEKLHPEWRDANETTKYPFAATASLRNNEGSIILEGSLLDAALYPPSDVGGFYLAALNVTPRLVTVTIGDAVNPNVATGTFSPSVPPDVLSLVDQYGRPAGALVSTAERMAGLAALGGPHSFTRAQTEFCATVCFPRPTPGVTGFLLPDGTVVSGEVWLVGGAGVVFTDEGVATHPSFGMCAVGGLNYRAVGVHVVGDPLFRRRLCAIDETFPAPSFLRTVRFTYGDDSFECGPNAGGEVRLVVDDTAAYDTVLRVSPRDGALWIGAVGLGGGT